MPRFSSARLALVALTAFAGLAGTAHAQSKDAWAKKLDKEAMDQDYLATKFADAEGKLKRAIEGCAPKACSAPVRAHLSVSLGIVLGSGESKIAEAKAAFIEALKIDPTVKLDRDLATPETAQAFEEAKTAAASAPAAGPKQLVHTVAAESAVDTAVPIYVEMPASVAPAHVTARYRAPGMADFRTLDLDRLGTGYGALVPCEDVTAEGDFEYYVIAVDSDEAAIASAGSRGQPLRTPIRATISSEAPHLPGQAAPASCKAPPPPVAVTPPPPEKETSTLPPCDSDRECDEGFTCVNQKCVDRDEAAELAPAAPTSTIKRNWVGLSAAVDFSAVSGDNVCTADSQKNDNFACFRGDGSQYGGKAAVRDKADNIQPGVAFSTVRVLASYDRVLTDNITLGGRLGFAFHGGPKPEGASAFLPVHVEGRAGYWLGKSPFERAGVRPFLFVSGGMMQVDTKVEVEVHEYVDSANPSSGTTKFNVDAWHRAGFAFAGAGVGAAYAPTPTTALVVDVRVAELFPASALVITPELGFATGF